MNIYSSPKSELQTQEMLNNKRVMLGRVFCFLSLLMLCSIIGLYQTLSALIGIIQDVSSSNAADPKVVAGRISQAFVYMVQWLFLAVFGWLCTLVAIFFSSYRSRRYFAVWLLSSVILIVSIPFGSLFGLILALVLFFKRKEFKKLS
ncbi:hypothetical protein N7931_09030 [Catenovulum sp. 2E275]|uniref:hypothetical protein n=1 Tax=Catenovulum sp. 2E275 TaxID=2980497 RepID=UPI0021CF0185|nr:hypothetical protein [Catenovulum sp. 2E275]MCU4675775.1 hypothetical protein [Catenovulum sp. 2E275]